MTDLRTREIEEAIDAGERALYSLRNAQQYLNSAGTWGMLDLFGGNFITGMMKHSKMQNANQCINQAQYDLQRFERELEDVQSFSDLSVEVGDFLMFADFFFDGFVADFMVQSKIAKSKRQIQEAISRVEDILDDLRRAYRR